MNVNNTHLVNKASLSTEIASIKTDMQQLVELSRSIFERVSRLESAVDASRKRRAPAEVDSDAFSEDDQSVQSKLIKLERDAMNNNNSHNGINVGDNSANANNVPSSSHPHAFRPVKKTEPKSSFEPNTSKARSSASTSASASTSSSPAQASTSNPKAPTTTPGPALIYDQNRVVVYTDGSCFNNGKANAKGGIGVYFNDGCSLNVSAPLPGKQSNNRAELQAAVKALTIVRDRGLGPVQIRTDSGYVKMGITNWIKTWKKNGWRTASNNEVKNVEDWRELDAMAASLDVDWQWVEAHKGIHGNEMADQLANDGARMKL